MKSFLAPVILMLCLALGDASPGFATGLYTCDSGLRSGWKSEDELKKNLTAQGWKVRRIKEDG